MSRKSTLYAAAILIGIAGLLPLAVMCAKSVILNGRLSFTYYGEIFASGRAWVDKVIDKVLTSVLLKSRQLV